MQLQGTERAVRHHQQLKITENLPARSLQREYGPADILIADFQAPEVQENKFLLFWANWFVVICPTSPRKLRQLFTKYMLNTSEFTG